MELGTAAVAARLAFGAAGAWWAWTAFGGRWAPVAFVVGFLVVPGWRRLAVGLPRFLLFLATAWVGGVAFGRWGVVGGAALGLAGWPLILAARSVIARRDRVSSGWS